MARKHMVIPVASLLRIPRRGAFPEKTCPLWPHLCIAPATHGKSDIEAVGAQVEIAI